MKFDWDAATVKVTVPVQHTATTDKQDIDVPMADFVAMMFDLYSRRVRAEMARKAGERTKELQASENSRMT